MQKFPDFKDFLLDIDLRKFHKRNGYSIGGK
jgi:hypothetical protein